MYKIQYKTIKPNKTLKNIKKNNEKQKKTIQYKHEYYYSGNNSIEAVSKPHNTIKKTQNKTLKYTTIQI